MKQGFTLIEILISLMIFSVVSIGMVLVLRNAVDIYRLGERSREATDEAGIVIATLSQDLANMLPEAEGGFFFARVADWGTGKPNAIAWAMRNGNPNSIGSSGQASHLLVVWWQDEYDRLHRATFASTSANPQGKSPDSSPTPPPSEWGMVQAIYNTNRQPQSATGTPLPDPSVFADGCLHLGLDIQKPGAPRQDLQWTVDANTQQMQPSPIDPIYKTTDPNPQGSAVDDPFPTAVRVTLILAGGRHRLQGTFVGTTPSGAFKIAGLKGIPTVNGLARIGDPEHPSTYPVEWIGYDTFSGSALGIGTGGPARNQLKYSSGNAPSRGAPVAIGAVYHLTHIIH